MSQPNPQPNSVDSVLDALLAPVTNTAFYDRFRQRPFPFRGFLLFCIFIFTFFFFLSYFVWWRAPRSFPADMLIAVQEGMTLTEASRFLKEHDVIRSPFWFKAWSVALGGNDGLKAGEYYLSAPISVFELAKRLTRGIQNIVPARVTIPEGLNNREVAAILSKHLPRFNRQKFLELAKKREGYLFPDTYTISPGATEVQIIAQMAGNLQKRLSSIRVELDAADKPLPELLIMASLIEGEARTSKTRRHVSGILWKRLELGMPLQVDAVFPYLLGKNTFQVTADDLKYDSPYNTYLYAGLPPAPINNPSLDAILAAAMPAETTYLYYLTDKDGNMHYAVTHDEHLVNRAKYLNK